MDFDDDTPNQEQLKSMKPYAVKVCRSDDEAMLMAHEKEYEIISSLEHVNVVKGVEMFRDDLKGEVYQVMELVEGLELLE